MQQSPSPSTPNPSLLVQTLGQSARAVHCPCNEGQCCFWVCHWPVRYGQSKSLQPRMLGEWWVERLDCMWPGSNLLITKAGGGENGRNDGTRRDGTWERRKVALDLKALRRQAWATRESSHGWNDQFQGHSMCMPYSTKES